MKKVAVVYFSKHGTTKQYAEWIAEETGADLFDVQSIKAADLAEYDLIVYGAGIYSGGIKNLDFIRKNMRKFRDKKIIAFAVGIAIANEENRKQCDEINFSKKKMQGIKCYYLPGAYDPSLIQGMDKRIMKLTRKFLVGGNANDFGSTLLGYIDNGCNLVDKGATSDVISAIKDAL